MADTTAPVVQLGGLRRQAALRRRAIVVTVACPAERCRASAAARLVIPGTARPVALNAAPRQVAGGRRAELRLALSRRVRRIALRALRHRRTLRATIRVTVLDDAGNRTVRRRTVLVTR